jgi:hypothetical protein
MSSEIVDKWMEKVRGRNNENSSKHGKYNVNMFANVLHRYVVVSRAELTV